MEKKGSVLVYTMVILALILSMSIGLASVATIQRKSTLTTAKSIEAFQVADSAAEIFLEKIYDDANPYTTPREFRLDPRFNCARGTKFIGSFDSERKYEVFFYDEDDNQLNCNNNVDIIVEVKVIGEFGGTTRAIQVTIGTQ